MNWVELLSTRTANHEDLANYSKRIKELAEIIDKKTLHRLELESLYNE